VPGAKKAKGVEEILELLASGSSIPLESGGVTQLDHALQTAAALEQSEPGDRELAVAGLVHDIGHLLQESSEEAHARIGSAVVRPLLGETVAGLVALHVEAKRFLVATDPSYVAILAGDSTASLAMQGGPMAQSQTVAFASLQLASRAVTLRRADDGAKTAGVRVKDLSEWRPMLRVLAELA
jgi:predicted HD phosphohydrolase